MAFSFEAQEVHDYIVAIGGGRHWTERAQAHLGARSGVAGAASRDLYGFTEELKAAFANKFSKLTDQDWDVVAGWLFGLAESSAKN